VLLDKLLINYGKESIVEAKMYKVMYLYTYGVLSGDQPQHREQS